jgi:hypothetical protein
MKPPAPGLITLIADGVANEEVPGGSSPEGLCAPSGRERANTALRGAIRTSPGRSFEPAKFDAMVDSASVLDSGCGWPGLEEVWRYAFSVLRTASERDENVENVPKDGNDSCPPTREPSSENLFLGWTGDDCTTASRLRSGKPLSRDATVVSRCIDFLPEVARFSIGEENDAVPRRFSKSSLSSSQSPTEGFTVPKWSGLC